MGCCIAGVGLQGFFQKGFGGFQLTLGSEKHPQVVVGLRLLGVGLGDLLEGLDGLVNLALLGLNHTLHEAPLHRFGGVLALFLDQLQSLFELSTLNGFFDGLFSSGRAL